MTLYWATCSTVGRVALPEPSKSSWISWLRKAVTHPSHSWPPYTGSGLGCELPLRVCKTFVRSPTPCNTCQCLQGPRRELLWRKYQCPPWLVSQRRKLVRLIRRIFYHGEVSTRRCEGCLGVCRMAASQDVASTGQTRFTSPALLQYHMLFPKLAQNQPPRNKEC